jgi:hypothetical protein
MKTTICNPAMDALFSKWSPIINKHKVSPNTEIEIRFGRKNSNNFDTNVGKATFDKVLAKLNKYDGWEKKDHSKKTIYYFSGNKRLIVSDDDDEQVGQIKTRVLVDDHNLDASLDIRLGISKEIPFEYDGEEESTKQRERERWQFERKNLSIDLSIVKGAPDDKDCDDDMSYQIELEIIDPSSVKSDVILYNILNKVFDVIKIV